MALLLPSPSPAVQPLLSLGLPPWPRPPHSPTCCSLASQMQRLLQLRVLAFELAVLFAGVLYPLPLPTLVFAHMSPFQWELPWPPILMYTCAGTYTRSHPPTPHLGFVCFHSMHPHLMYYIYILLNILYLPPIQWKLHEHRTFLILVDCCIPRAWNGVWYIVADQ